KVWNDLRVGGDIERQAMQPMRSSLTWMVLVGLAGAIAGASAAPVVCYGRQHNSEQWMRLYAEVERHEGKGLKIEPWEFALYYGVLGGLGGFAGAAVGWMFGGAADVTMTRGIGAIIGALWAFDGAIYGMYHGGMPGCLFGTLIATVIVTFIATKMGVIVI